MNLYTTSGKSKSGALKRLVGMALVLALAGMGRAQTGADSVDVTHYDISLDLSAGTPFQGDATLTLALTRPCSVIALQLIGVADSVEVAGVRMASPSLDAIPTAGIAVGQPFQIRVWYTGRRNSEPGGWGGFHFDNDMHYNLGVGFNANPHSMGRSMFPCRDNFTDKATYTLRVRSMPGWRAECGGMLQSRTTDDEGCELTQWHISQPTPTYLVSVSQAAWQYVYDTISSVYGNYPLSVGYLYRSESNVRNAFALLDTVVPMFERCFGPYRWERIGYIGTHKGSMEHVNNIALDMNFVGSTSERAQSTIAHELGHAWFGNLVTCATSSDMWINEGGASFTSEVAMQADRGRLTADEYYQRNLEMVLRTAHITDNGYRPLSPMPHDYTYGSTTYDKGWMVWHSLRGYLGDSVFYGALERLMRNHAFGTLDALQLRDSLSLYSGMDLTDFFNFHVFTPGFVDYHLDARMGGGGCDPRLVNLIIRQQGVGTQAVPGSIRIPVTFFSASGQKTKLWFAVQDTIDDEVFSLPFEPAFCVLDLDKEISDAATVEKAHLLGSNSTQTMPVVHLTLRSAEPMEIYAEHHWGRPWGEMPYGVQRTALRYWVLRGQWDSTDAVRGRFHYLRDGYNGADYAYLDRGFYSKPASLDSMALFYRPGAGNPWRMLKHSLSGNASEGYLVADSILPGEYTLAIVDTLMLALPGVRPTPAEVTLFPNPLPQGGELIIEVPVEEPFRLSIFDAEGRLVWQKENCRTGQRVRPALAKGTYFVRIENNFISLQSKLIQL